MWSACTPNSHISPPHSTLGASHDFRLHIPYDLREAARAVPVNERNVVSYYPYISGGPAEGVHVSFEDDADHVVYVNSRYTNMEEAALNRRATALLESAGIRMALVSRVASVFSVVG